MIMIVITISRMGHKSDASQVMLRAEGKEQDRCSR